MNTDPLCGRTIENVMTTNIISSDPYCVNDNSVYELIYLETKNNEPFPEYDSKIKELEILKEQEIQKALTKINKKYNKLFKDSEKILEKRKVLTRDEFSEWFNSLPNIIKNNMQKSIDKISKENEKCKYVEDMYTLNDDINTIDSIYCILGIDSGLIKNPTSYFELTDDFYETEKRIFSNRNKSASEN